MVVDTYLFFIRSAETGTAGTKTTMASGQYSFSGEYPIGKDVLNK